MTFGPSSKFLKGVGFLFSVESGVAAWLPFSRFLRNIDISNRLLNQDSFLADLFMASQGEASCVRLWMLMARRGAVLSMARGAEISLSCVWG